MNGETINEGGPVVTVGGAAIPPDAIMAEAQHHPAETMEAAMAEAAHALVVRELLVQEARRAGLRAEELGDDDAPREAEEDELIRRLIEREVEVPSAGEAECRRYYDRNTTKFRSEPLYHARHVLLAAAPDDEAGRARARVEAEAIIESLTSRPEDFARFAEQYSACPSKQQGGNLGQITRGSVVQEFETALGRMAEGEVAPQPVETKYGFHVVLLDRRIAGETLPFEAVRDRIAAWLEASAWSRAVAQYISILAGRTEVRGINLAAADTPLVQ